MLQLGHDNEPGSTLYKCPYGAEITVITATVSGPLLRQVYTMQSFQRTGLNRGLLLVLTSALHQTYLAFYTFK